jgi:hypothetical protein
MVLAQRPAWRQIVVLLLLPNIVYLPKALSCWLLQLQVMKVCFCRYLYVWHLLLRLLPLLLPLLLLLRVVVAVVVVGGQVLCSMLGALPHASMCSPARQQASHSAGKLGKTGHFDYRGGSHTVL